MRPLLRLLPFAAALAIVVACGVTQNRSTSPTTAPAQTGRSSAKTTDTWSCAPLTPPASAQFPAGFDYPQSASTVEGWSQSNGNGGSTRNHAYCLFAGLNQIWQGTGLPTWRMWGTTSQIFAYQYNPWPPSGSTGAQLATERPRPVTINETRSRARGKVGEIVNRGPIYGVNQAVVSKYPQCLQKIPGTRPQLYSLIDGQVFQNNGDIMVAAVSYNPPALNAIRSRNLYDAAVLDRTLPAQPTSPSTSIAAMPSGSIVLKVMLWPVAGGGSTWTSVTALPIWDWYANKPGSSSDNQYAGYEMQKFWTNAAAISSGPVSGPQNAARVQFLYGVLDANGNPMGPNTYNNGQVVGLDRFYSRTYSDMELGALSPCDRAILDAAAYWNYNRAFQSGDSLALIAMHIMTKEQSDWTFQSAWWHPDALACTGSNSRFCGERPASVPGGDTTWKNYMMTTTYGMHQIQPRSQHPNYYVPPSTIGTAWPVAYNPYIELAATHPITTNCMNCHHRAAWPPDNPEQKPDRGRASAYLQSSPPNPNALETFTTSNGIFNGLTMVDSMWAVSDRAGYATSNTNSSGSRPK